MRLGFFLLLLVGIASAQANVHINPGEHSNRLSEYRQVVGNYCRFDYDGARLSPTGWDRIKALTTWRENPDFKRIVVVNRYEILPDTTNARGHVVYTIQYDVSGEYDLVGGYFPGPATNTVQIEVGDFNGDARVLDLAQQHPFVGRFRFQQWLQQKIAAETDPGVKSVLESSLQRFQQQSKKTASGQ
jgi:hypothetical protein